jgi:hypothetical protein
MQSVKPATLLRVASALALIQYLAHATLFLSARPTHGPSEIAVIDAMSSRLPGLPRTYWDFYFGYGLLAILSGFVEIVVLWQLSMIAATEGRRARPIIAVFLVANVVHALLVWTYFRLVPPVAFDFLVAVTLGLALVAAGGTAVSSDLGATHSRR